MGYFKNVWKDPVWSKVISAGITFLISYFATIISPVIKDFFLIPIPLWIVCIIILSVYILFMFSNYYGKIEREKKAEQNRRNESNVEKINKHRDDVWSAFVGLDDQDIELLLRLYNSRKSDPENEHIRMVNDSDYYTYCSIIEKTNIPSSDLFRDIYQPCIIFNKIGNKIYFTFAPYFYELLKHYAKTGEKTKLKLE